MAKKREKGILPFATSQIDLEVIILSKISQPEKNAIFWTKYRSACVINICYMLKHSFKTLSGVNLWEVLNSTALKNLNFCYFIIATKNMTFWALSLINKILYVPCQQDFSKEDKEEQNFKMVINNFSDIRKVQKN